MSRQTEGMQPGGEWQSQGLLPLAIGFLSRREYSREELKAKLCRRLGPDESPDAVDAVLDTLEQKGYLSNLRFAEQLVRQKSARYGAFRLKAELRRKGVPEDDIREALRTVEVSSSERAYAVWSRKFSCLPDGEKEKARQVRFLLARGFSYSDIQDVFARAREAEQD